MSNLPVITFEHDDVGNNKTMDTKATMFPNGMLLIEATSRSAHPTEGLRGRVFVICIDDQGRAMYVSSEHVCTTRGSIFDIFTPSKGKDNFIESLPEPVGRLTASLDIVQGSGPLGDWRANLIRQIRDAGTVATEVVPYILALVATL